MNWAIVVTSISSLAQTTVPTVPTVTTAPAAAKPFYADLFGNPLIPIMVIAAVFLFLSSSGKRKEEKKKKALLSQIKRGDRVQTVGGIIGKVVETEPTRILLKVDESSNTKIWFARRAVAEVLGDEKAVEVASK